MAAPHPPFSATASASCSDAGVGRQAVRFYDGWRGAGDGQEIFVAGVIVGAGIGWLIDRALGISPWGLTVFLLLGFAAGVLNVMRSAGITPK